ncbi:mutator type transposase [Tanacetum coccineum]
MFSYLFHNPMPFSSHQGSGGLPVEKLWLHLSSMHTYNNLFSIKLHYGGRFTDSLNKLYVDGEVCFVDMLDIDDFKVENLNSVMCRIGYEDDDELLLYYKIPLKSLDVGLKRVVSDTDFSNKNFIGYVKNHKIIDFYLELVKKTESSSDEDGQSDNESEDANDLLHGEDETDFIDPIQPHVNVTEDDLEVLDFDSLESGQEEVPENVRSRGLRKLRKKHMSYGIRNNFYIGKEFANRDLAKERIRAYAVETRKNLDFKKGKGIMQDAKEDKLSCPWLLYLSKGDKSKWLVKTFKDEHKCLQSRQIKHCTSTFLSKLITDLITMNPQIPIKVIQEQMQKKYHVSVSKHKAFRAKAKVQVHLRGNVKIQYSLLRDYANELQRCNPDTTVKIDVYGEEDHEKPTRMFRRIYVCLGALKRGFKESGRELLGLDGAFMRGQYSGQMLTAGLVPTIAKLFPAAEHRFCVRHINKNMNITWKGGDYKEMLWKCATSTTVVRFKKSMAELKNYNKKTHERLSKIPPEHWSRAYFSGRAHYDLLINNMCEVFNRQLLDVRDNPIITSLEYVREYLIKRIVIIQKIIQKGDGPLTPTVTKLFNKIKKVASKCSIDWNGSDLFQVKGPYQDQCVFNLNQKTCSCKKLEISGILCKHVIAAIHDMEDNDMDVGTLEDWVHESYKLQTRMNVYAHKINLINGRDMWSKFECPTTLLPPKKAPRIGRPPKNKNKRKCEIAMVKGHKLTRKGTTVTCSNCKASQPVASQPVSRKTRSRGPVASQHVSSQIVARKQVARKPVTRKLVQASQSSQPASGKRPSSQINEPASQSSQSSQPASQASRLPTSPMKRTKMTACSVVHKVGEAGWCSSARYGWERFRSVVVMSRPVDYSKLKMELETTDVEDMLTLSRSYAQTVWLVGDGLSKEEQLKASKGTLIIPYSQFPPNKVNKGCSYYTTPAMLAPKHLENVDSCEIMNSDNILEASRETEGYFIKSKIVTVIKDASVKAHCYVSLRIFLQQSGEKAVDFPHVSDIFQDIVSDFNENGFLTFFVGYGVYEDEEHEKTGKRFSLASLLEVNPQNYQVLL